MKCPTCGQEIGRKVLGADELLHVLRHGQPHRNVYRGQSGGWWVTHGGGETSEDAIRQLIEAGEIHSVYSDCPMDAYHIGRTWDVPRSLAYRKGRRRKDWRDFYVSDPPDVAVGIDSIATKMNT